jgi:transposase
LQRHRFGRRAETLPEDQLLFGLEEVEQTAASTEAESEASAPAERASQVAKRRINRGSLPAHLRRIEMMVDIDDHACPCCQGALHRIGEDVSERLDIVRAQFRVLVVRRPKYACRACENGVVQAAAPARLIEGGLPTEATVAQVLVSKYADHLPPKVTGVPFSKLLAQHSDPLAVSLRPKNRTGAILATTFHCVETNVSGETGDNTRAPRR